MTAKIVLSQIPPPGESIRILLVEDDELFRLGLRVRLEQEEDLKIVGEAADGETAVQLSRQLTPDVVLLDLGIPGIGGIEACRQIHQPVLVLTSRFQKSLVPRLIDAGACGYCLKGIEAKQLILAIRTVSIGASWWDRQATLEIQELVKCRDEVGNAPNATIGLLTRREQEILSLLAKGKTNQEIAELLYIVPGTVRVHVHAILQKLEVSDRTQAAIVALQKGLLGN